MGWLALMPFPAFNPLNWSALTNPRNMMLASLNNAQLALDAWRVGTDSLRALVRLQQDEALRMLQLPLGGEEAGESQPATHPEPEAEADAAPFYVRPMLEATRAYNQVGRAFIVAQRESLRALAREQQQH